MKNGSNWNAFYYDKMSAVFRMVTTGTEPQTNTDITNDTLVGLEIGTLSVIAPSTAAAGAIVVTQNANQAMLSLTQNALSATAPVFELSAYSVENNIDGPLVSATNVDNSVNTALNNVEGHLYMKVYIVDSYNPNNDGVYYITLNKIT